MDFSGNLSLFSNNEPLLDKRIFKFLEYAKKNLPKANHLMYTNGLLLDRKKFLSLVENLDELIIDNYDDDFKIMPHLQKILESDLPKDIKCNVNIYLRKKHQKLHTRADQAPNKSDEKKYRAHSACILPFTQMIVRPDGTAAKCCNEPLGDFTLGDLNKQTLLEVWHGEKYQQFRKAMYFGERDTVKGCEFCDIFGLYNKMPPSTIPNEIERVVKEIAFRKNFGKVYIFDTNSISKEFFNRLRAKGIEIDGLINLSDAEPEDKNFPYATLEKVFAEHAFIFIPSPFYDDRLFEILQANGYKYEKDFLIYSYSVW